MLLWLQMVSGACVSPVSNLPASAWPNGLKALTSYMHRDPVRLPAYVFAADSLLPPLTPLLRFPPHPPLNKD
ncbi:hypothetical protein M440DRAFT_1403842 [Trichoderma longibrachiatum ATCC 18648]|uniref:Uncharacterized protein n=1 Tax=Trichoderma longibrachiatum ATCC 18648 TaxID=983965 RepID=A0A2T4BYZ5_TRILO|nr:hypothetical protein M440DRAFT_1403842 [Trichoderma longibrachiatum ATCC 18648]